MAVWITIYILTEDGYFVYKLCWSPKCHFCEPFCFYFHNQSKEKNNNFTNKFILLGCWWFLWLFFPIIILFKQLCPYLQCIECRVEQVYRMFFFSLLFLPWFGRYFIFSVLTPYYKEDVLYSDEELHKENEDGISILFYLKKIYPGESYFDLLCYAF